MWFVSCRLLACSRAISSLMFTSESPEVMCFSSSIFASSSAIGCSKSRNATAILHAYRCTPGFGRLRAPPRIRKALGNGRRRGGAEAQFHPIAADEILERNQQFTRRPHAPLTAQRERARGVCAAVFDRDRTRSRAPAHEDL